jgi:hypothetical protein
MLYEIFERRPNGRWRMVVVAPGHPEFLRQVDDIYWIGQPYSLCRWNEDGETIFAQSDLLPVWTSYIAEQILTTKVMQGFGRAAMGLTVFDKDLGITKETLEGFTNPEVGRYLGVENNSPGTPIASKFFTPPSPSNSPEALNLLGMMERMWQISSGLGPNQFGQALKSGTSASEANEIANIARARASHKFDGFESFVLDVARKRMGLMAQFYNRVRAKRIVGKELGAHWPDSGYSRRDVERGLRLMIHQGSMQPEDDNVRASQLSTVLQILATNPLLASVINVPKAMERLLYAMGFMRGDPIIVRKDAQAVSDDLIGQTFLQSGGAPGQPGTSGPATTAGEAAQR